MHIWSIPVVGKFVHIGNRQICIARSLIHPLDGLRVRSVQLMMLTKRSAGTLDAGNKISVLATGDHMYAGELSHIFNGAK